MNKQTTQNLASNPHLPSRRECLKALAEHKRIAAANPFEGSKYMLANSAAISAGAVALDEVVQALQAASPDTKIESDFALALINRMEPSE